jgi:entericidin B
MKLLPILLIGLVLVGCNTVRGLGQDVERGGEAIQKAAK